MRNEDESPAQGTFEAAWVAESLGVKTPPARVSAFTRIVSDSRQVTTGALFVALSGENHDGHAFIPKAIEQGANGILCRKGTKIAKSDSSNLQVFEVKDTLVAYRELAARWRRRFTLPVIMVAGSVGKTTTKELLATILGGRFASVLKTQASQNGFVGIPMTLLELRDQHGAAVIEVGIDEPGAMKAHVDLVHPDSSVLTAIGPEHLEKLIDIETVAREESIAIIEVAKMKGKVSINLDDPWIRPLMNQVPADQAYLFSLSTEIEDSRTLNGSLNADSTSITLNGLGFEGVELDLPLPGEHNARNLLAALTLARIHGVTPAECLHGLSRFQGATGRSEVKTLGDGTRVLCDYYNANPTSMEAAFKLSSQLSSGKPVWACLADMLELGPGEEQMHRDLAGEIISHGITHVLLHGPRMRHLLDELKRRKFKGTIEHFEEKDALAEKLNAKRKPGEMILIKGSRGMRMETVFEKLAEKA